jgi:hypothetical protein
MPWIRFFAILLLVIPGAIATYGWTLMREVLFNYFNPDIATFLWGKFLLGFLLFVSGVAFIGGFIFHRDKKRRRVQRRFLNDDD